MPREKGSRLNAKAAAQVPQREQPKTKRRPYGSVSGNGAKTKQPFIQRLSQESVARLR